MLTLLIVRAACSAESTLDTAQQLLFTGRYEEAREQFVELADDHHVEAALGIARCDLAVGDYDAARRRLKELIERGKANPAFHAELAQLSFLQGKYQPAKENCDQAIAIDKNQLLARLVRAELHRTAGELDEAEKAYAWLVDFYNDNEVSDAQSLHIIGQAAGELARWRRDSERFRFLVSRLYPSILRQEKNFWPARLAMGRLFAEKYNQREATKQFSAALAINPNSAEVHAARAELALQSYDSPRAATAINRALEINPNLLLAHQLQADLHMANFRVKQAIEVLEAARPLNPRSEATLGRLAAAYWYVEGGESAGDETSRLSKLLAEAEAANPKCGAFYEAMGDALDLLRKYPAVATAYQNAHQRMPQLIAVPGKLGLVQMRLGDETAAKQLLEQSFKDDPFHVRVKNSLEVLDVLDNYAVIETEHFVIKFDRGQDQMLAEYAAVYLEEDVYPQIVKDLGYAPKEKSLFEIFSRAKNTSGHGWFSARMVGLPYIGTVGACAGQMVAIASPGDMPEPYNWARVLKHEFVHVVNLQQTDFNIPHWFTEALAVRSEGFPRPSDWTQLLARRFAADTLFSLDGINDGFLRPGAGDDWTLAYCQAEVYAEYMIARFGDDAPAKMLAAYRDNRSTEEAIAHCFGVKQDDFEAGYREFVKGIVADVDGAKPQAAMTLAQLQKAVREKPDDADALADLAYALIVRRSNTDARRYALAALKIDRSQQLAAYVMARLYLSIGDREAAFKYLRDSFDEATPQKNHLALLAGLLMKAEKFDEAEELYALGAAKFPHDDAWPKRLATVYVKTGDEEKLTEVLTQLAQLDTDSVAFRMKLAEMAMGREDFEAAEHWAMEALYINIKNADAHKLRGDALAKLNRHSEAAKEYGYALKINPGLDEARQLLDSLPKE